MASGKSRNSRRSPETPAGAPAGDAVELLEVEVGNLLDELRDEEGAEIVVWRAPGPQRPREQYLFYCSASAMTLPQLMDKLRDEYRGGDFRVRGRKGSRFYGGSRTLSIEAPAEPRAGGTPAAPAVDGMPSIGAMLMMMQKQSHELMLAMMKGNNGGGASMQDVIGAARVMAGQAPPSLVSQLAELKGIKEFFQDDASPKVGATDADLILAAIEKIGGPMLAAFAAAGANAPAVPGAANAAPALTQRPPPAGPVPPPLQLLLMRLVRAAQSDSDPGAYAVVAIDELGEAAAEKLLALPDPLGALAQMVPAIAPALQQYAAWFNEFISEARDQLAPDEGNPPAPPAQQEVEENGKGIRGPEPESLGGVADAHGADNGGGSVAIAIAEPGRGSDRTGRPHGRAPRQRPARKSGVDAGEAKA